MEVVVTTGAISCAKIQSNHHHQQTTPSFFYRPDAFLCPTNVKALKGKTTNNLHLWANIGTYMSTLIQFFFQKGDVFY